MIIMKAFFQAIRGNGINRLKGIDEKWKYFKTIKIYKDST